MRLVKGFAKFLEDEVNLNKTRIGTLTDRVEAIEGFLPSASLGGEGQSIQFAGVLGAQDDH
jgi:hypothetical protein